MDKFHYVACGLPNVWLENGYTIGVSNDGKPVFHIENVKGLHKAIALSLVGKDTLLTGDEFRFLRGEIKLTRKFLASVIGYSEETVKKWESGENPIQKTADMTLRNLYLESQNQKSIVRELLEKINHLEKKHTELFFKDGEEGWEAEKKCA
ncbi:MULTISPECIES: transcriptional regulator [Pseudomonas]|uniref:transcriptional regulator n=1 Tax=Pseudomonas TaxID=286 RepID=UPI001C65C182|nr:MULTISPECIES: transcriptional regulator [unclassified Pseudomonas]MBW8126590.1 transcriptional regulator [Pseudomonas sp. LAP_36]MBW8135389.1 transcriptional regulator [Pseudomonas sp. PAMC 26818]